MIQNMRVFGWVLVAFTIPWTLLSMYIMANSDLVEAAGAAGMWLAIEVWFLVLSCSMFFMSRVLVVLEEIRDK